MSNEIRCVEIGAVQKIENFRTELQVQTLVNMRVLQNGKIPCGEARPSVLIPPDVSKKSTIVGLRDKSVGIEPLIRISEYDWTSKGRVEKRSNRIASISVIGRVVAKLRSKRKPGLHGHNAIQRPSANHLTHNAAPAPKICSTLPKRQFIGCRHHADVSHIVRCQSPIGSWHVRIRQQSHCIRRRGCVQRVSIIQCLRPGIDATESKPVAEAALQVNLERVVRTPALGEPGPRICEVPVRFGCARSDEERSSRYCCAA